MSDNAKSIFIRPSTYILPSTVVLVNLIQLPFGPNEWYQSLIKPPLNPPDWVFGVVWPILYILIAISLTWWWQTRHLRSDYLNNKIGFLFGTNLLFNALYSPLTFGLESLEWGLATTSVVAVTSALLIYNLSLDGDHDGDHQAGEAQSESLRLPDGDDVAPTPTTSPPPTRPTVRRSWR